MLFIAIRDNKMATPDFRFNLAILYVVFFSKGLVETAQRTESMDEGVVEEIDS